MRDAQDPLAAGQVSAPGDNTRTVISLLLVIHGFCVLVALGGVYARSPLGQRVAEVISPYTGLLNLDPSSARLYLTHGTEEYDDHVVEVSVADSTGAPLLRLPDAGWRGGMRRDRYRRLAAALALAARNELDSVSGIYAKAIGAHLMAQRGVSHVVVRCRALTARPMEQRGGEPPARGPTAREVGDVLVYEADVWRAADRGIAVLKRLSPREVAPVVSSTP